MTDKLRSIPIIELFASIEGEGSLAGRPMMFARLSGCNLRCMFDNSICDTAYASFDPEKGKYTYEDVEQFIEKHPLISDFCISGGEPFLYPNVMRKLCEMAKDLFVSVETNGTIEPPKELFEKIDLFNISPKLSSSEPTQEKCDKIKTEFKGVMKNHSKLRFNKKVLWTIIDKAKAFNLKYVVGSEKDFEEIEQQIKELIDYDISIRENHVRYPLIDYKTKKEYWYDSEFIKPWDITLMPAGSNQEELKQNRRMVAEYCVEHGYNYSDRLQIVIWNTEKER